MKIVIDPMTYLQGGGESPYMYISALLNTRLKQQYGSAIKTIEVYPRLPVPDGLRPTADNLFDQWQTALEKLPYLAFRRKVARFELAFCSTNFTMADMNDWWSEKLKRAEKFSIESIRLAGGELQAALPFIKKRIKPSDDFDVSRFLADVEALFLDLPASMKEWNAVKQLADQAFRASRDAMDPWEQLEIDWSEFHPKARELLDDPFYWDCLDDIAPHGNDTGAEVLDDFQRWNKRHSRKSPVELLEKMSSKLGIAPFDWSVTKKSDVLKIAKQRPLEMDIANETAIALAFAALKLRARCSADVVELARSALVRTSIIVKASNLSDEIKTEWDAGIKRMTAKLDAVPQ